MTDRDPKNSKSDAAVNQFNAPAGSKTEENNGPLAEVIKNNETVSTPNPALNQIFEEMKKRQTDRELKNTKSEDDINQLKTHDD